MNMTATTISTVDKILNATAGNYSREQVQKAIEDNAPEPSSPYDKWWAVVMRICNSYNLDSIHKRDYTYNEFSEIVIANCNPNFSPYLKHRITQWLYYGM